MPSWKKLIQSGSKAHLTQITASDIKFTGTLYQGDSPFTSPAEIGIIDSTDTTITPAVSSIKLTGAGVSLASDGADVTATFSGGGGTLTKKFGVGSGSDNPQDWVVQLASGVPSASGGDIVIQTSASNGFNPNYYTFSTLTNSRGWCTIQSGSEPSFSVPDSIPAFGVNGVSIPGETKYTIPGQRTFLITATDSGSKETHDIFTTTTIQQFSNNPPVCDAGLNQTASIGHDSQSVNVYFYATNSYDIDELNDNGDFIRLWTLDRSTNYGHFEVTMSHPDESTGTTGTSLSHDYLGVSGIRSGSLIFTASIGSYDFTPPSDAESEHTFTLTIQDSNGASTSDQVKMSVPAPPTASISNLRIEVEDGVGTKIPATSYTTKILYGDNTTRYNTSSLADMYTASLVRIRCCADITEPPGYNPGTHTHPTYVRVVKDGASSDWGFFRFEFGEQTASSWGTSLSNVNTSPGTATGSDGFVFVGGLSSDNYTFKIKSDTNENDIFHGSNNHYSASLGANTTIEVDNYDDVVVNYELEVEANNSGSNVGAHSRTTRILHGSPTTSIDKSVGINLGSKEQLTSVRLLANIKESFGPHHAKVRFIFDDYITNDKTWFMFTGSADVSSSASLDYTTHGSQSVSYTSSWYPVELDQTRTLSINTNDVTRLDNSTQGYTTTYLQRSKDSDATITVQAPQTASVAVTPVADYNDFTASTAQFPFVHLGYYGADNNNNDIKSGWTIVAPETSSVATTDFDDSDFTFKWSVLDGEDDYDSKTTPTASFDLDDSYGNGLTTQDRNLLKCEVTNSINGTAKDLGSGSAEFEFYVLPREPRSMHGKYFSANGDSDGSGNNNGLRMNGHKIQTTEGALGAWISTPNTTERIFKGSLSSDLGNYKSGEPAGTHVENIMMARNDANTATEYSMSFSTTDQSTGNQVSSMYNYGDSGSLIVKLNGSVVASASLQIPFTQEYRPTNQIMADYDTGNWSNGISEFADGKGRIELNSVQPYNNFSGSIDGFPNGYQVWRATIYVDSKIREGYNRLEFSHSIDATTTHSLAEPFEWYYDDDFAEPSIDTSGNPTMSLIPVGDITHSLSGVSFFKEKDTPSADYVSGSFLGDRIHDLTSNTFRAQTSTTKYLLKTEILSGGANYNTASYTSNGRTILYHTLHSTEYQTQYGVKGLSFNDATGIIPTTESKANLTQLKFWSRTLDANPSDGLGVVPLFKITPRKRYFTDDDNWGNSDNTHTTALGRWIEVPTADNDVDEEDFYSEEYRWTSKSIAESSSLDDDGSNTIGTDYNFWTNTSNTDWNSTTNISQSDDLQQTYQGKLIYPTLNYNVSNSYATEYPNSRDYSNADGSGDRYYFRAFDLGTTSTADFNIEVWSSTLASSDIFADSDENFDSKKVRIDIKFPGNIGGGGTTNNSSNNGSGWLTVTGGNGHAYATTSGDNPINDDVKVFVSFFDKGTSAGQSGHADKMVFNITTGQWSSGNVDGVILMRIRYKNTAGTDDAIETLKMAIGHATAVGG